MKLTYKKSDCIIICEYGNIQASCVVRNEINGLRKLTETVQRPIVGGVYLNKAYMPRTFPNGLWKVYEVEWENENWSEEQKKVFAPCKIKTNAVQEVELWTTKNGHYGEKTGEVVIDEGYYLHHSEYRTTLGCIRISNYDDAKAFGKLIEGKLKDGETVTIEVTD